MPYLKENFLKMYSIIKFFIFQNRVCLCIKNSGHPHLYSIIEFYSRIEYSIFELYVHTSKIILFNLYSSWIHNYTNEPFEEDDDDNSIYSTIVDSENAPVSQINQSSQPTAQLIQQAIRDVLTLCSSAFIILP